jgi:ribosomal protein S18 acetylase RimI-like enzyme
MYIRGFIRAVNLMAIIKSITSASWVSLKEVRLRALADTPLAFGSTFEQESQLTDADWQERAAKWTSERSASYLAWDGNHACGIAAGFLDLDNPATAHLISMWVAPTHRRQAVGRLLVNGVIDWARLRQVVALKLMVTSSNDDALRFYQNMGFVKTGRLEPYPNDAALVEFEMSRVVSGQG